MLPSQGIEVLSVHQVTLERFDDGVHFTLRPAFISRQLLDAIPLCGAIICATMSFIKELAMLLAHVLAISSAIFDFHFILHIWKIVSALHCARIIPPTTPPPLPRVNNRDFAKLIGIPKCRQKGKKLRANDIASGQFDKIITM